MGAYNRTNGEPCCGSKTLLQDILEESGELSSRVPYGDLVTTTFAENAAK